MYSPYRTLSSLPLLNTALPRSQNNTLLLRLLLDPPPVIPLAELADHRLEHGHNVEVIALCVSFQSAGNAV